MHAVNAKDNIMEKSNKIRKVTIDARIQEKVTVHLFDIQNINLNYCFYIASTVFTAQEKEYLVAIKTKQRLKEYLAGHLLVRIIIGNASNENWENIQILDDKQNKPFAYTDSCSVMPSFNISHSSQFLAIAICDHGNLGLDIESPEMRSLHRSELLSIAERNFSATEILALHRSENMVKTFYRLWTMKEAILKTLGTGLVVKLLKNIDTSKMYHIENSCSYRLQSNHIKGETVSLKYLYLDEIDCHLSLGRKYTLGEVMIIHHISPDSIIHRALKLNESSRRTNSR